MPWGQPVECETGEPKGESMEERPREERRSARERESDSVEAGGLRGSGSSTVSQPGEAEAVSRRVLVIQGRGPTGHFTSAHL